jgi:hypothetical protein
VKIQVQSSSVRRDRQINTVFRRLVGVAEETMYGAKGIRGSLPMPRRGIAALSPGGRPQAAAPPNSFRHKYLLMALQQGWFEGRRGSIAASASNPIALSRKTNPSSGGVIAERLGNGKDSRAQLTKSLARENVVVLTDLFMAPR